MTKIQQLLIQTNNIKSSLEELGEMEFFLTPKKNTGYFKLEDHSFYFSCDVENDNVTWQEVVRDSHSKEADQWFKCKSHQVAYFAKTKLDFDRTTLKIRHGKLSKNNQ